MGWALEPQLHGRVCAGLCEGDVLGDRSPRMDAGGCQLIYESAPVGVRVVEVVPHVHVPGPTFRDYGGRRMPDQAWASDGIPVIVDQRVQLPDLTTLSIGGRAGRQEQASQHNDHVSQ